MMTPDVVSVTVAAAFKLRVTFASGERRLFDLNPYLQYPAFESLRSEGFFSLARVEHGTVAWPNGTDISPDTLYCEGTPLDSLP